MCRKVNIIGLPGSLILVLFFSSCSQFPNSPEIHSQYFLYGYPTEAPATNDLIVRDIYALSSNDDGKFSDWVAYRLDSVTVTGN